MTTEASTQPSVPAMPEGGDAKYYDATSGTYNWAGHVTELNYKLAQQGQKTPPADPAAQTQQTPQNQPSAAVDWDALAAQASASGKLDDASYEQLTRMGVPRAIVDSYVQTVHQQAASAKQEAYAAVGGEDVWNTASAWAQKNLSAAEITTFNEALQGPNWKQAMTDLVKRAGLTIPATGVDVTPGAGNGVTGTAQGYMDAQEMIRDINAVDPANPHKRRYKTDPAYRAEVDERIRASQWHVGAAQWTKR